MKPERIAELKALLLAGLPKLWSMPIHIDRLFSDPLVAAMGPATDGQYIKLLLRLWQRQGWLPWDDAVIARTLGLDVRTWRAAHKAKIAPCLQVDDDPFIGKFCWQPHLVEVMAAQARSTDKNKRRTAAATAKRVANSKAGHAATSATEPDVTTTVTKDVTNNVTSNVTSTKQEARIEEVTGLQPVTDPYSASSEALLPTSTGKVEPSPPVASLGLGARSAPSSASAEDGQKMIGPEKLAELRAILAGAVPQAFPAKPRSAVPAQPSGPVDPVLRRVGETHDVDAEIEGEALQHKGLSNGHDAEDEPAAAAGGAEREPADDVGQSAPAEPGGDRSGEGGVPAAQRAEPEGRKPAPGLGTIADRMAAARRRREADERGGQP